MRSPGLYWRTIRHLTLRQLRYQLLNRVRGRGKLHFPSRVPTGYFLAVPNPDNPVSFAAGSFTFLNQSVSFSDQIDWNHASFGKLWTYHLNYFDFLNQPGLSVDTGLFLIHDFIRQTDALNAGLEPYPTSLRINNWVQFLSRNQIQDGTINCHLFAQTNLLNRRLEYHLSGNHLLENGFTLLIAAWYFRQNDWLKTAVKLLYTELATQILTDGGHYERSPVYHQFLFDHLLTVLFALQADSWYQNRPLLYFLTNKAHQMLGWLDRFTFRNGDVPMVNDAAYGMAPVTSQLRAKARQISALNVADQESTAVAVTRMLDSGYRMLRVGCFELFADVGPVGPDHQPGHVHADTFSFVLCVDNQPVIVDNSTSTYEFGPRRTWERSTAAHNTVEITGQNSSEVWANFRVGRRAQPTILTDTKTCLMARHDGYRHLGVTHQRTWQVQPENLTVVDQLFTPDEPGTNRQQGVARLFFQSGISVVLTETEAVAGPLRLTFEADAQPSVTLSTYELADGFNKYQPAQCLTIVFLGRLTSTFTPTA